MANDEHVALLKKGVDAWNKWRAENPDIRPDLRKADLNDADLSKADLRKADLEEADLSKADLWKADLQGADLSKAIIWKVDLGGANLFGAHLSGTYLSEADLSGADLRRANLTGADLSGASLSKADLSLADLSDAKLMGAYLREADLRGANLTGAALQAAILVQADLMGADLTGCRVYGVSAWGLKLEGAKQQNLVITLENEPTITVDNIEVAQFIYLMLHNEKIRDVIDTITSKAVLILGRFTEDRKAGLNALRGELRNRNYVPILFDFDKPTNQTTDETITLLARMSRFVIADISDAKSVLQELRAIVPDLPSVPVQPVIIATQEEPGMFDFFRNYRSFLKVHHYNDQQQLIADLGERVIGPAEKWRSARGAAAGPTG